MLSRSLTKQKYKNADEVKIKYTLKGKPPITFQVALRRTSAAGDYDGVVELLPFIAKINEPCVSDGRTALHWAGIKGQAEIFCVLEQNGAMAELEDANGFSPLDYLSKTNLNGFISRNKNFNFFLNDFESILFVNIFPFLNAAGLQKTLTISRHYYHGPLTKLYRHLQTTSMNPLEYLSGTTYLEATRPDNPLLSGKDDRAKWIMARCKIETNFNSLTMHGYPFFDSPYAILILERYLSAELAQTLKKHSALFAAILSSNGLKLFQKKILTNEFIVSAAATELSASFLALVIERGTKELLSNHINLEQVWNLQNEISTLVNKFGNPPSMTEAVNLVSQGVHLNEANYNWMGDMINDPYVSARNLMTLS